MINGDLITGESESVVSFSSVSEADQSLMIDTFRENSTSLIDSVVRPLNAAKIPFSSTSGVSTLYSTRLLSSDFYPQNHDSHINITRADEIARETAISHLSYTRFSPPGVGGAGGPGNYWVPVYRKVTGESVQAVLHEFPQ